MNFRDILTVAKKDLTAYAKDKVILMQVLLLPFIIVYAYSTLMGTMSNADDTSESSIVDAYYVNAPDEFEKCFKELGYQKAEEDRIDSIKKDVENKKAELLIVFPNDFKMTVEGSTDPDNIEVWYNSEKTGSLKQYNTASEMINSFQPKAFTVNASEDVKYDMGDEDAPLKSLLGTIFPSIALMSIFMVCMNLAAQSIAGEKERGFMNTLLITPVKRSSLAIGKSLSIFVTAVIGGLSAFVGMAMALPKIAGAAGADSGFTFSISEYALLFAVTMSAVFVLVGILLIVSTVAKDVKQATTIAPMFLLILMVCAMLTMSESIKEMVEGFGIYNYFIPAWNTMRVLQEMIEMKYDLINVVITCGVDLLVTVVMIFIVSKLFNREKMLSD